MFTRESILKNARRRSVKNRHGSMIVGCVLVGVILILGLFPQVFTSYDPLALDGASKLLPPSAEHLFGTDHYGRDVFARVLYATKLDLFIGVGAMLPPCIFGSVLGLLCGYYGGKLDAIVMRILDIFIAFPFMVLVIAIVAIIGPGTKGLFFAMWIVGWKEYTRLIRSEVLVVKHAEYVQAAKTLGYSELRIMFRHILPNVISSAIVYGTTDIVLCMMTGASMSYLSLGVQPPTPEWGAIISGGKGFLTTAWWITVLPGLVLAATGLGFSLIGDGLSDVLRRKDH